MTLIAQCGFSQFGVNYEAGDEITAEHIQSWPRGLRVSTFENRMASEDIKGSAPCDVNDDDDAVPLTDATAKKGKGGKAKGKGGKKKDEGDAGEGGAEGDGSDGE